MIQHIKKFTPRDGKLYLVLDQTLKVVAVTDEQALVIDWPDTVVETGETVVCVELAAFEQLTLLWGLRDLGVGVTDGNFVVPSWGLTVPVEPRETLPYDMDKFLAFVLRPAKKSPQSCEIRTAAWRKINAWVDLMKPHSVQIGTGKHLVVEDIEEGWKIVTVGGMTDR